MLQPRRNFGLSNVRDRLFAVGGLDPRPCALSAAEMYDPTLDEWTSVASMTTPRSYLCLASVHNQLFALGGGDEGVVLSSVERYDEANDVWALAAPMSTARRAFGVGVMGHSVYAVGGRNATEDALASVERFDAETNTWSDVSPMTAARSHLTVAVVAENQLLAIGGLSPKYATSTVLARYDVRIGRWETMPAPGLGPYVANVMFTSKTRAHE